MYMKKYSALFACLLAACLLCGCGGASTAPAPTPTEAPAAETPSYTGQMRAITFALPEGWARKDLTNAPASIELRLGSPEKDQALISYGCQDIYPSVQSDETPRSKVNLENFDLSNATPSEGLNILQKEVVTIGKNDVFLFRYSSEKTAGISAMLLENGYLHTISLLEYAPEIPSGHEQVFNELLQSVVLPAGE